VDDEESTRLLLARMLADDLGVEAQLAGTCEQALKRAGNYAYDAILLDLLMPGVGGLGVLAAIRAAAIYARQAGAISAGIPIKHGLKHEGREIEIPPSGLSRVDFANS